jgi:AbrB family looped-hinge helix DNA binding protein
MKYTKSGIIMSKNEEDMHIYGTVKVGDRGQIVIPAQARKDFNIKPGDLLLVVTGKNRRGITMIKADDMREFASKVLKGLDQHTDE